MSCPMCDPDRIQESNNRKSLEDYFFIVPYHYVDICDRKKDDDLDAESNLYEEIYQHESSHYEVIGFKDEVV